MKKSEYEIREATPEELKEFYGIRFHEVGDVYGAFIDGKPVGMSGVMCDPTVFGTLFEDDGRLIGFLDTKDMPKDLGPQSIRAIKAYLKRVRKEIYVQCDTNNFPNAERLLKILGFVATEEMTKDARDPDKIMRLWRWQV